MAKRQMSAQYRSAIEQIMADDPDFAEQAIPMLEAKGFDVSGLSIPEPDEGGFFDEAAAFGSGMAEGFTYGAYEAESAGKDAYTVDLPVVGEIQPSREAGRLLGGAGSGSLLWGLGLKTMGRAATTNTMKSLAKRGVGSKATRKLMARGVGSAASAIPEGLVGSIATGIREDDLEAAARAFPEWMALGVGSDALFAGFQKMYRRWKGGGKVSKDARERLAKQLEDEANETQMHHENDWRPPAEQDRITALKEDDPWHAEDLPPMSAYEADIGNPVETQQLNKLVDRKVGAAVKEAEQRQDLEAQPSARESADQEKLLDQAEEMVSSDGNVIKSSFAETKERLADDLRSSVKHLTTRRNSPDGVRAKNEEILINKVRDADLHYRNFVNEGPRDKGEEYFKGLRIVRSDKALSGGVGARYTQGTDFMTLDEKKLRKIYEETSWADHRRLKYAGITGITKNAFKSYEEFEAFVMQHEFWHSLIDYTAWQKDYATKAELKSIKKKLKKGASEADKKADYENWVNRLSLDLFGDAKPGSTKPAVKNKITPKTSGMRTLYRDEVRERAEEQVGSAYRTQAAREAQAKEFEDLKREVDEDTLPFQVQANGQEVPLNLKVEIASMVDRIQRIMPKVSAKYNIANILPDDITLEQANIIRNNLAEAQYWGDVLHHDRIAQQLEANGPSTGLVDEMTPDVAIALDQVGQKELHQAPGFLSRIVGPYSRNGLGANRMTRWFANETMRTMDEKQAKVGKWMGEYMEIRKLVGMQDQSRLKAMMGRMGGTDPEQAAREKLYELARVLDTPGGEIPSGWDANMKQAYQRYRKMMVEVADDLGMDRDRRIGDYLHHFFAGRSGQYRATQLSSRLGSEPGQAGRLLKKVVEGELEDEATLESYVRDLMDNVQREGTAIRERGFRALLKREANAPDFEYDLDHLTRVYLMGAGEKWFSNSVFPRAQQILHHLPDTDIAGNAISLRREFSEYVNHLMGRSTESRQKVAIWFGQNNLFNKGFDNMIEFIGGAPKRGILGKARGAAADDDEARQAATNFLDELDEAARVYDRVTGEATNNATNRRMRTTRAKMALRLEDLRQALANPSLSAPVANQLYRVQILSKLGLNMAHGLVNTTQTLVNTWPLLKKGYTSRAIVNYTMKGSRRQIKGYDVDDLLDMSGIRGDASKVEEFIEMNGTWLGDFQNFMMAPSKMSEDFNRSVAFLGFYEQFRDAGEGHILAMKKAVDGVQKTQFPFNRAGTPPVLRGPMTRLFFMFKSYPIHQTDFSAHLITDGYRAARNARAEGKSLAESLEDDDVMGALKHIFAYIALIGGGFTLFPETNIGDKSLPPAANMPKDAIEGVGRYGALGSLANALGGPFNESMRRGVMTSASGIEALSALVGISDNTGGEAGVEFLRHGRKTAESLLEPTSIRKLRENGFPDTNDDWLQLLSLKRYRPAEKKQSIPGVVF